MSAQPTVGRIVLYKLSGQDAKLIESSRVMRAARLSKPRAALDDPAAVPAYVDHSHARMFGNEAREGAICPAVVVAKFPGTRADKVNLQVFLDGYDTFWATSRIEGDEPGTWAWPVRDGGGV